MRVDSTVLLGDIMQRTQVSVQNVDIQHYECFSLLHIVFNFDQKDRPRDPCFVFVWRVISFYGFARFRILPRRRAIMIRCQVCLFHLKVSTDHIESVL